MGATAGDLMARDLVCDWLVERRIPFDTATASPFPGGVTWESVDPVLYSHVLFICGPFGNGKPLTPLLEQFKHARWIGIDLTMLQSLDEWNPFDLLLERDSTRTTRPDLVFLSQRPAVPVVGRVLVHPQKEYKERSLHEKANAMIHQLVESQSMACVNIDTRLDLNSTGLRTPEEVESLIAKMDLILTTRLHGLVLAIKNGVPAIAIDPISGGDKIKKQAVSIGWPIHFIADHLHLEDLNEAYEYCQTEEARQLAMDCRRRAISLLQGVKETVLSDLMQFN